MSKVNKMFLITPHEMSRLSRTESNSIRQTAEDDLDEKMRSILDEKGMTSYEKVKRYEALLHRYLSLMRQGQKDERRVTLKLQSEPTSAFEQNSTEISDQPVQTDHSRSEDVKSEVIKNLPQRDRKNAQYIMQKLSEGGVDWNSRGEFVHKGNAVKGSHIMDLFKNLSLSYKKPQSSPKGWTRFLNTLAEVNVPLSMVNNRHACDEYKSLKMDGDGIEEETPMQKRRTKINLSPRWMTDAGDEYKMDGIEDKTPMQRHKRRVKLSPRWMKWD